MRISQITICISICAISQVGLKSGIKNMSSITQKAKFYEAEPKENFAIHSIIRVLFVPNFYSHLYDTVLITINVIEQITHT